ncbi:hypothetical protein PI124_g22493 [Phytophthora idaei]|nr:hypothetical protein PI125_g24847 [Phytophthora idaei]KAG3125016.1 hypothetical protein PI126_g22964 [Phytophthora idaei]KAG3232425.1 hypothetical protein PI124_g22493 [Phytophthora idaei]
MFLMQDQLAALNADVTDQTIINLLIRSLPSNSRFGLLRGMVETGTSEVDSSDKRKIQSLRMDSDNKCDKELG